ncbi:hypothetical protein JD844_020961 [Phrynosoma platyrhinos]|uniref:GOLD domain-containing protein n=1 Tax=Phrynosoma platyrhinos TaxID=52577 RepID=A0ABQ7ST71_PHRPL|nr:hypothetical protein JD844_020961 [Phrynosoma platyrhinos]
MSDVLAAAEGARSQASAAGGLCDGGRGGSEGDGERLSPSSENEDITQQPEPTSQIATTSGNDALPCRLQNGPSINEDTTKDSERGDGNHEEQDVAGKEILTDQLQQQKEAGEEVKVKERSTRPPLLIPPTTWTSSKIREFKVKMAKEKNARMVVKRGEVLTVRVPTHPDGKRVCWEFATEDYDIGFGVYFDWTPITSTAITVQVSESSDEEDEEEEFEGPIPVGDVERGSKSYLRSRYGEIMPVYRRDSHQEVQVGSHDYPGEGIYLLKFDNSYSLLRNKILFFHVYYTS